MPTIAEAIGALYPSASSLTDYEVVDFGSGQVIARWNAAKLGAQPTPAALAAVTDADVAAARLTKARAAAAALLDAAGDDPALVRAVVAVLVDELNALRQWDTALKAAIAAATSLANLQTRVAALANTPDRTLAQARAAVAQKITAGAVDS